MVQDVGYSIQIMASRCGMTAHTLRYYERVGLIQPVRRGQPKCVAQSRNRSKSAARRHRIRTTIA